MTNWIDATQVRHAYFMLYIEIARLSYPPSKLQCDDLETSGFYLAFIMSQSVFYELAASLVSPVGGKTISDSLSTPSISFRYAPLFEQSFYNVISPHF